MKFFVKFEVLEQLSGFSPQMQRTREAIGKAIGRITGSGKLESGGVLAGVRGGYFVLRDIDSAEQLFEMLGGEILDHCRLESHPVMSFEALGEFFRRNPVPH